MDKKQLLHKGIELKNEFCSANGIFEPPVRSYNRDEWRVSACGYYRPSTIHISPTHCAHIGTAGRAWSYPGYAIDRTPYGVIAHELGHHVDHMLSLNKGAYGGDFSSNLRKLTGEAKLTNYCPNDWEWFAELFRLYVTNSDLLRLMRPATYDRLRQQYKPVVDAPWFEVLKDAPDRTIEMARKKIAA